MSSRAQDVAGRSLTRDLQSVIDDGTRHAAAFAAMTEDAINHALVQRGLLPPFTVTSR
jgi:hypothetical protein